MKDEELRGLKTGDRLWAINRMDDVPETHFWAGEHGPVEVVFLRLQMTREGESQRAFVVPIFDGHEVASNAEALHFTRKDAINWFISELTTHSERVGAKVEKMRAMLEGVGTEPSPSTAVERLLDDGGCTFAGPGRGDCEHAVGLPGISIPGRHDGDDDTVDFAGKPNGWCWSCWRSKRIADLEAELGHLQSIQAAGKQLKE